MTPLDTLRALVELQEIDLRIRELEKDRQQIPARLDEIAAILGEKREALKTDQNLLDDAELARRVAESDLKAEKEKIKKWEARLGEIRNNRDYQALSREIESARKANLGIEDEILRKMQEIEDLKGSIAEKEEELAGLEGQLLGEKAELEEQLRSLNERIEQENAVRQQAVEKVDPRWYRQYQTIKDRRDGLAVVAVRDEHCQGCHMGIPPQLYNIVLKGQEIKSCPFCQRIFYYPPALEQPSSASEQAG